MVLARRGGIRASGDDGDHGAWRQPWRIRAVEQGRAHEGGERSSTRTAVAQARPPRHGVGGNAAWVSGRASRAAHVSCAVVNLAMVAMSRAGLSVHVPLFETPCSSFQTKTGLEHCTKDLHPSSLSTLIKVLWLLVTLIKR
jgi:hypothetical protein